MTPGRFGSAPTAPWWRWLWLWPPVAVGVFLRLFRLPSQLLLADELHAPRAALRWDMETILTTYLPSDHSMPLTGLLELLMENGVAVSEIHLRLPILVAAMIALVVIPVALARRLGTGVGVWSAWLVAVSPGMVLYGRLARSYMPMILLAFLAAVAFERWWRTRRPAAAVAYAGFGAAAVWFHLGAAPFVAAPLLWGGAAALLRPSRWRDLLALSAVGLGLAAGWAAFLVPARESFLELFGDKAGYEPPGAGAVVEIFMLQAGATEVWAAALFWGLALLGLGVLARRRAAFASYSLVLVLASPAAVLVMQPLGWANPLVTNRYLLIGLPWVLVWVAVALAWLGGFAQRRWPAGRSQRRVALRVLVPKLLAPLALALLVLGGPWTDSRVLYSSFLHDDSFIRFSRPAPELDVDVPAEDFYRRLGQAPGDGQVLEFTATPTWTQQTQLAAYQVLHRRRVLLAPHEVNLFGDFKPRNYVEPGGQRFLASPARWLVIHRRTCWERDRMEPRLTCHPEPMRRVSRRVARRLGNHLARQWGAADYQDTEIRAWDLDRVRSDRAGALPGSALPVPGM